MTEFDKFKLKEWKIQCSVRLWGNQTWIISCNTSISQTILPTTMYVFSWVNTGIIHPCDTWRIFVRWGYSLWYSPSIEECLIGHNSITSCSIIPGCAIVARSFVCFIVEDTKWMHTVIATPLLKRGREGEGEGGGGREGERRSTWAMTL